MHRKIYGIVVLGMFFLAIIILNHRVQAQNNNNLGGVQIDANHILEIQTVVESLAELKARQAASVHSLDKDLVKYNPLRFVSLTRLEREVAASSKNGTTLPEEVRYMAGLQRITCVLVYPETGDVIIGGPAEGWYTDATNRVMGLTTGMPVLHLEDLVAAMRAFSQQDVKNRMIGCSIDPTQEGLANLQTYLKRVGSTARPQDTPALVRGLRDSLGMQNISVYGVDPRTNAARVLVEADYRMKLIGIGLEKTPVPMKSFVAAANPSQIDRNALCRWYFVPDYHCVRMSPDRLALALDGQGIKLIGEDELVMADGQRKETGTANAASKQFTTSFTREYHKIAQKLPVYAQLRNIADCAVVAAYLQKENIYGQLNWKLVWFGNEERFPICTQTEPKQVASAVSAVWRGRRLMTPIGGGVEICADKALEKENIISVADEKVAKQKEDVQKKVPENGWWWN